MRKSFLFLLNGALALLYILTVNQSAERARQADITQMGLRAALLDEHLSIEKQKVLSAFEQADSFNSQRQLGAAVLDSQFVQHVGRGVSLQPNERARAMLRAALRGRTVVELVMPGNRPVWIAMVPMDAPNRVRVGLFQWEPHSEKDMQSFLWLENQLIRTNQSQVPMTLPADLQQTIFARENRWAGIAKFGEEMRLACAVPVKDFDAWDVTGALLLMQPASTQTAAILAAMLKPSALIGLLAVAVAGLGLTLKLRRANVPNQEQST